MRINFLKKPMADQLNFFVEFIVERQIKISESNFYELINNPVADSKIISEFKELMYIDENGIHHCIYLYFGDSDFGLLVNSEGTDYLRNVICVDKKILALK